MKTNNYSNLKAKTIFDFTNNEELLNKTFPNYNENNKKQIIESLLSDTVANGFYLWSYAELCKDSEMISAIKQQFDIKAIYGFDPD